MVKQLLLASSLLIVTAVHAQNALDPCANGQVTPGFAIINQTSNHAIITGAAGKITYICSFNIVNATAQNVAIVEGTGITCATGPVGMSGGNTAATGWSLAANAVVAVSNGNNWVNKTATAGDDVCIFQSSTGQISGGVRYVQQ